MLNRLNVKYLSNSLSLKSFFDDNNLTRDAEIQKMNVTLKNEYPRATPIGVFPEFSILTSFSGNSGCHKECWGSCSFSSPRLLHVSLVIPYFLGSNNTIPTCIAHKDKRDLLPVKFKLVKG